MQSDQAVQHVLAVNLRRLMDASRNLRTEGAVGTAAGVNQSTVNRMLRATHSPSIDKLALVAGAFGLEAWMLLVPDIDPANPPALALRRSEAHLVQGLAIAAESLGRYKSTPND